MNRISCILMSGLLFSVILLTGCATIGSYRITQEKDWIEGNPFPVSITFTYNEKVDSCTLYYTVNKGEIYEIPLKLFGSEYGYVIPGDHIVEGELDYYFYATGEGDEYRSKTYSVTILNYEQATRKYTQELLDRIVFNPPDAIPFFEDAVLSLTVKKSKADTEVILNYKKIEETEYKKRPLAGTAGNFQGIISNQEINENYRDYYFTITENHPDVGLLTVHLPNAADSAPYSLTIIDKDEMYAIMLEELKKGISFTPPDTVPETKDLTIILTIKYPLGSYMNKYEKNRRKVIIHYGNRNLLQKFKSAEMASKNGEFYMTIKKEELEKGYNSFYFDIQDTLDHIGVIELTYPDNGNNEPFTYRIKTKEELVAEKKAEVYSRISHNPPETVESISDLILELEFLKITEETEVKIYYRQSSGMTDFKFREMNNIGNSFQGVITVDELKHNYNKYYFLITVKDDLAGVVILDYPSQGNKNPYSFTIESSEDIYKRLQNNLSERITFVPVLEITEGSSLALKLDIDAPLKGTEVFIHYRNNRDKKYKMIGMKKSGNRFSGEISGDEFSKKNNRYYIEVKEPHYYFDYISVLYPLEGPGKPYKLKIISSDEDDEDPDDTPDDPDGEPVVYPEFSFTPLSNIKHNKTVNVEIKSNMTYPGLEVYFKYRITQKSSEYTSVKMKQNGLIFSAEIPPSAMRPKDQIDYYFIVVLSEDGISYTVPEEDEIPLTVIVNKK